MIDVTEIKRKKIDDWRETQGIKWRIVKTNRSWRILIICPRCGKVGYLARENFRGRVGYRIIHSRWSYCRFGWTSNEYDTLRKIRTTTLKLLPHHV